MESVIGREQR